MRWPFFFTHAAPSPFFGKRRPNKESYIVELPFGMNVVPLFSQTVARGQNYAARRSQVVITHGFLGSSQSWQTVAKHLASHPLIADKLDTMYSVDLRNHGRSPHADAHSNALMCTDLESFCLDKVEASAHSQQPTSTDRRDGNSILVGHSMGGTVVMSSLFRRYNEAEIRKRLGQRTTIAGKGSSNADDDPQDTVGAMNLLPGDVGSRLYDFNADKTTPSGRVAAAVIVDITPFSNRPATFDAVQADLNAMKALDLSRIHSTSDGAACLANLGVESSQMRNFLLTNLTIRHTQDPTSSTASKFRWKCNLDVLHRDFDKIVASVDPDRPVFENSLVPCPTPMLFVFGAKSPYNTPTAKDRIRRYFSCVEMVEIPGAGHFVHYEKMVDFVESVVPFMYEHMR